MQHESFLTRSLEQDIINKDFKISHVQSISLTIVQTKLKNNIFWNNKKVNNEILPFYNFVLNALHPILWLIVRVPFLNFFEPITLTFFGEYCPYVIKNKRKNNYMMEPYSFMFKCSSYFCNHHLHKQQPGSDLIQNTVILEYQ